MEIFAQPESLCEAASAGIGSGQWNGAMGRAGTLRKLLGWEVVVVVMVVAQRDSR